MKKIFLTAADPDDIRVLADLLRAQFPEAELVVTAESETAEGAERFSIAIEPAVPPMEAVSVRLLYRGREYSRTERPREPLFQEEPVNRHRRLLRLAVYRAVATALAACGGREKLSPWGVLTGVRPAKIVHRLFEAGYGEERVNDHLLEDYGISPEKARLAIDVVKEQRAYFAEGSSTEPAHEKNVDVYIGIPFCPTRCHYCSFPSYALDRYGHMTDRYLAALGFELAGVGETMKRLGLVVRTLYIGGGTPTSLTDLQLETLLSGVETALPLAEKREVTVEGGRPDTLDQEKLLVLKNHGVSRISINPQTMNDLTLAAIGRQHSAAEIIEKYQMARRIGFAVVNMDLIIGLPGEDSETLKETLAAVLALRPENITLHALAMKRAAYYRQEKVALPKRDEGGLCSEGGRMMSLAHESLRQHGYRPYYLYRQKEIFAHCENVGYALPGSFCRYNIEMMEERQTILGFGVGAGSKFLQRDGRSLENTYNPKDLGVYLNRLEEIIGTKVDKLTAII